MMYEMRLPFHLLLDEEVLQAVWNTSMREELLGQMEESRESSSPALPSADFQYQAVKVGLSHPPLSSSSSTRSGVFATKQGLL